MNGKFTTQTDDRAVSPVIGVILMVAIKTARTTKLYNPFAAGGR